ncbi:MAG: class I SAM-dependent methyltransferase [Terriglobia bacterium]
MMTLPAEFDAIVAEAWQQARPVQGYMGEREFRALALLAALSTHAAEPGVIVEIGSFKGKSTIALAKVAGALTLGAVVSIDPHTAPSQTDPDLRGKLSSFDEFLATLRAAGIEQQVEVHRASSQDVAQGWARRIRLLWIDGDHTYLGAKQDLDLFLPHLGDGGLVAIHDVLHEFEGPVRVFVESILRSDAFGPAGFSGSIGWAQYRPRDGSRFRDRRERLARRAARLIPLVAGGREVKGFSKLRYKFRRATVLRASPPLAEQEISLRRPETYRP